MGKDPDMTLVNADAARAHAGATDGRMRAVQAGASQMSAADQAGWTGVYTQWGAWLAGLYSALGDSFPSIWSSDVNVYGYTMSDEWAAADAKLNGYDAQAAAWHARIPGAAPLPAPVVPLPSALLGSTASGWPTTILVVAVVGGAAYALHGALTGVSLIKRFRR
jgi:hypothetical protein